LFGITVICLEAAELVPLVIYGIHQGKVRPPQFILQLEVVRWVSKDEVYTLIGEGSEELEVVAQEDLVEREIAHNS